MEGTDGVNGTLDEAGFLSYSSTTVTTGSMSTLTDEFDVYYISPFSTSSSVSVTVMDTVGSPTCYAYTRAYRSLDTSADPKAAADSDGLMTAKGTLSATPKNITISDYSYLYIVCRAGTTGDIYKLVTTTGSSFDFSSLLTLMCVGAGATCKSECDAQQSY